MLDKSIGISYPIIEVIPPFLIPNEQSTPFLQYILIHRYVVGISLSVVTIKIKIKYLYRRYNRFKIENFGG